VVSTVVTIEEDIKEDPKVDMGIVVVVDMVEEVLGPPNVSIVVRLVMYHNFVLSRACSVHIFIVLNM